MCHRDCWLHIEIAGNTQRMHDRDRFTLFWKTSRNFVIVKHQLTYVDYVFKDIFYKDTSKAANRRLEFIIGII